QGRAQALNLRDSGIVVRVGLRAESSSITRAQADGLTAEPTATVAAWADVLVLLIPDEAQPGLLRELSPVIGHGEGRALGFAHGFAITYGGLELPAASGVFLVAPCAPGARMR